MAATGVRLSENKDLACFNVYGCAHAQLEVAYQIQIMTRNSTNSATNSSWNFLDAHHIFRDTCALARANCCDLKLWEQQCQDLGCCTRKHTTRLRT